MKAGFILSFLLLLWLQGFQLLPFRQRPSSGKTKLREIFTAEIGIRERTGHNDGFRVEEYLAYTGLKKGDPWCAAFVCWCLGKAGISNPCSGYSPALFPKAKLIWIRGSPLPKKVLAGDVFGLYYPEKGRIAHVGFVEQLAGNMLISVEGNTNKSGSNEGDGVYRKRRLLKTVYSMARW